MFFNKLLINILFFILCSGAVYAEPVTKKTTEKLLGQLLFNEFSTKNNGKLLNYELGPINQICFHQPDGEIQLYTEQNQHNIQYSCDGVDSSLDYYGLSIHHFMPLLTDRLFLNTGIEGVYMPLDADNDFQYQIDPLFDDNKNSQILPGGSVSLNYALSKRLHTSIGWEKIYNYNNHQGIDYVPAKLTWLF